MKCFIIMRDRLTWPKQLARQCEDRGLEVIFVDNGSTYPPLIEWYDRECIYPKWFWQNRETWHEWYDRLLKNFSDRYFIITDPDLDISSVPEDFLEKMMEGLSYGFKCGLSLEIEDLPRNDYGNKAADYEKRFWQEKKGDFYKADVSTTFALYDREKGGFSIDAVRTPKPYTVKHLSWYLIGMDEEERYYQQHSAHTGWKP